MVKKFQGEILRENLRIRHLKESASKPLSEKIGIRSSEVISQKLTNQNCQRWHHPLQRQHPVHQYQTHQYQSLFYRR